MRTAADRVNCRRNLVNAMLWSSGCAVGVATIVWVGVAYWVPAHTVP